MAELEPFPDRAVVDAEAAAWVAQVDGGGLSAADRAGLEEWLARSPRHRARFESLSRVNVEMSGAMLGALSSERELSLGETVGLLARHKPRRAASLAIGLIAAVIGLGWLGMPHESVVGPAEVVVYATKVGEQRTLSLPDGSELVLNTGTTVRVAFTEDHRDLEIVRGEALFDVAHDPERPFLVHAGDGLVRAIGTVFAVRLDRGVVEVTVEEGRVELASLGGIGTNEAVIISASEHAEMRGGVAEVRTLAEPSLSRELSWRGGMLVFEGTPLPEVVAEVSRYTPTKIAIASQRLRAVKVDGYFAVGEVDVLLSALEDGFGVEVDRVSDNTVFLR